MEKKCVLIPTKLDAVARRLLEEQGGYEVVQDESGDPAALASRHPETHALIVRSEPVTAGLIDALPKLKVIIRAGSGYNTIDVKHARKRGVDVMNTPGANANAVAEEVIALMLADARHIVAADPSVRSGRWEKKRFMGREISGKTMGIVGLGYIGRTLARRLRGFDMKLLGYDPAMSAERARELGVELVDLPDLFAASDYVTLHLPENRDTKGLVGEALLSGLKTGATLINCARSGVVDAGAVRRAVAERNLRYLNDVYPKDAEGPKPEADFAALLLPHLGASTREANIQAARRAAEQLIDYDTKGITAFVVNRDVPEGLDAAYGELAYVITRLCRAVVGRQTQLKLIETSFYGDLKPFANWLVLPVVAAVSDGEFDRSMDAAAARAYLRELGVDYSDRETDDAKGYRNSITVDVTGSVDDDHLRHASVRGTVAEGTLMISRINDFDKLYFEPRGHAVCFVYQDRPGVLGQIGAALADAEINIDDVRNPHDSKGLRSLALLQVNRAVSPELAERIGRQIGAESAFSLRLREHTEA